MRKLVEEMVELNSRCKYMFLLQHYCPVKAVDEPSEIEAQEPPTADLLASSSTNDQACLEWASEHERRQRLIDNTLWLLSH
ncbi:hypothetical protein BG000_000741 [Podila horticola]|nr:hypothetical protein BG000_000741 [Podila horticola]